MPAVVRPAADRPAPPAAAAADRLVVLANVPYRFLHQRWQHLAAGLAADADVLYVEPNRSVLQALRRPPGFAEGDPPGDRLTVFRPPPGLPGGRSAGLINRLNYRRVAGKLAPLAGRPAAVVVTYPDQADLLPYLPGAAVVYDVMDEPDLFLNAWQRPRYARLHAHLVARADLVVVSSGVLLARYRPAARRIACVGNGVRADLAGRVRAAAADPAVAALPRPRVGYVGMISHWFDFAAVRAIAAAVPHAAVVLVGPADVPVPDLPANVVRVGPVPQARLPGVLAGFDLGLIPFVPSPAVDAVNPVKLYEYLSAGLPVLASDAEEVRRFAPLVQTYRGPADAGRLAADLAGRPPDPAAVAARVGFAADHHWAAKAAQFRAAVRAAVAAADRPA